MTITKADKKAAGRNNIEETRMVEAEQPRNFIHKGNKDYYGGGLMILIGLGATYQGIGYQVGELTQMGPGFFPVALGILLALVGAIIVLGAMRGARRGLTASSRPQEKEEYLRPEWKGWICITLSIVAFIALGKYGGLLPATFAVVFIAAMGDRQNTVKNACCLALGMVVVCLVVFSWALKLQFPLFRWG
jgi:hypothetical protein